MLGWPRHHAATATQDDYLDYGEGAEEDEQLLQDGEQEQQPRRRESDELQALLREEDSGPTLAAAGSQPAGSTGAQQCAGGARSAGAGPAGHQLQRQHPAARGAARGGSGGRGRAPGAFPQLQRHAQAGMGQVPPFAPAGGLMLNGSHLSPAHLQGGWCWCRARVLRLGRRRIACHAHTPCVCSAPCCA
jgi:hypothetical protein